MAEGFYRRKQSPPKAGPRLPVTQPIEITKHIDTPGVIASPAGHRASAPDRSAQIDAEIRTLMHASMERDDEEALFTILTALEY